MSPCSHVATRARIQANTAVEKLAEPLHTSMLLKAPIVLVGFDRSAAEKKQKERATIEGHLLSPLAQLDTISCAAPSPLLPFLFCVVDLHRMHHSSPVLQPALLLCAPPVPLAAVTNILSIPSHRPNWFSPIRQLTSFYKLFCPYPPTQTKDLQKRKR
jgi:hypothetical protein